MCVCVSVYMYTCPCIDSICVAHGLCVYVHSVSIRYSADLCVEIESESVCVCMYLLYGIHLTVRC